MRRAPIVLTATVLGTAGVLLFKPLSTATVTDTTGTGQSSTSSSDTGSGSGSSSSSSSTGSSTGGSGSTSSPSTGSDSSSGSSSSTSTVTDGTYTGTAETVRYGTTQVEVTIKGGRITDVTVLQQNEDDPRSTQISESATPTLREEVLAQQTAAVDVVSGATYTSDQYEASLQSALDKAGYTAPDGSTASTDVSSIEESGGGPDH